MTFRTDTRGAAINVTYVLTLSITGVLITGLLISAGALYDNQQKRSARLQLQDIGGDISSKISQFDHIKNKTHGEGSMSTTVSLPNTVAGDTYSAEIRAKDFNDDGDTESVLYLNASTNSASVKIPVGNETWVETGGIQTDEFEMRLCRGKPRAPYSPRGQLIIFGGECP